MTNAIEILKPITKFCKQITNPNSIKYYLDKAFYEAQNLRPGPIYLEIPLDIQSAKFDISKFKTFLPKIEKVKKLNINLLKKYLSKSKKPIFLLGNGINIAQQSEKIKKIIKKLKVPTLTTQLGKAAIDYKNNYFIGHTGPKGDRAGNLAI